MYIYIYIYAPTNFFFCGVIKSLFPLGYCGMYPADPWSWKFGGIDDRRGIVDENCWFSVC